MKQQRPLALIAGAGPGLGQTLMQVAADSGYVSVGLRRSNTFIANNTDNQIGLSCDLSDGDAVQSAVQGIIDQYGAPQLVVHNPATLVIKPFLETQLDEFEGCWQNMVLSAANLAQSVVPSMIDAGGGTMIFSGATASIRGGRNFAAFASAKFALRGLAQSLAREFQPSGIHVAHTLLDGLIDTPASRELHKADPATMMKTEEIAAEYLRLAQQPRSVWTHELDLRPQTESF